MDQVDDWLERLIEEKGEDLYRMKGVLSVDGSEQRYVFQVHILYADFFFFFVEILLKHSSKSFLQFVRGYIPRWMVVRAIPGDPMKRGLTSLSL